MIILTKYHDWYNYFDILWYRFIDTIYIIYKKAVNVPDPKILHLDTCFIYIIIIFK
jgi:hypothetical protein